MFQPYLVVFMMSLTEESWVVHTDIPYEDLGRMAGEHFHYDDVILKWLVSYYPYAKHRPMGVTPPTPLFLPLELDGINITRHIVLRKELLHGGE